MWEYMLCDTRHAYTWIVACDTWPIVSFGCVFLLSMRFIYILRSTNYMICRMWCCRLPYVVFHLVIWSLCDTRYTICDTICDECEFVSLMAPKKNGNPFRNRCCKTPDRQPLKKKKKRCCPPLTNAHKLTRVTKNILRSTKFCEAPSDSYTYLKWPVRLRVIPGVWHQVCVCSLCPCV